MVMVMVVRLANGQWMVDSGWHVSRRAVSVACYREAREETSRLPQLKLSIFLPHCKEYRIGF